jgi:hypothetical protein
MKTLAAVCIFHLTLGFSASTTQDIPRSIEKSIIMVRVTRVKRVKDGCAASLESDKVRFEVSSDTTGACTILRVGENYKAFIATTRSPEKAAANDDSADTTVLTVYNNVKSSNVRENSVFEIESQELVRNPSKPK